MCVTSALRWRWGQFQRAPTTCTNHKLHFTECLNSTVPTVDFSCVKTNIPLAIHEKFMVCACHWNWLHMQTTWMFYGMFEPNWTQLYLPYVPFWWLTQAVQEWRWQPKPSLLNCGKDSPVVTALTQPNIHHIITTHVTVLVLLPQLIAQEHSRRNRLISQIHNQTNLSIWGIKLNIN